MNKVIIYDNALAQWGYDRQVLATSEECSELAASCVRFVNHKANASRVAEEAADVEIMIEQSKARLLTRLANRVGVEVNSVATCTPYVTSLLADAQEQFELVDALYRDRETNNRYAAAGLRRCVALLMRAAQLMIREQQHNESHQAGVKK